MTPVREAIVLPVLFLTVTLLGGLRIDAAVRLIPPSLTALVLAMVLIATLTRGRVLVPFALVDSSRGGLENTSGFIVLATLFAASTQVVNLLVPDHGLLHAAFAIALFLQLLSINATGAGRHGVLRSLAVLGGSLFALRFIVIEALYAPAGGMLQRLLTTLMSGATLGGLTYEPNAPATGYIAFATLILYMVGLVLLPSRTVNESNALARTGGAARSLTTALLLAVLAASAGCRAKPSPATDAEAPPVKKSSGLPSLVSDSQREAALRRAQVWQQPATPIGSADLKRNPQAPGAFEESDQVECRLELKPMGGTTPKFDCRLANGDVVRVKYGRGNPELHAEVVATRLLAALGFGADRMYVIKRVKCAGCSAFPFQSLRCLEETGLEQVCFPRGVDYSSAAEFDYAVIERPLEGRKIESSKDEGWGWYEIDRVDAAAGGAPRAQVDALKLFAVLIAHWDNKAENQRLLCLPGGDQPDGSCSKPLAILQDVGAAFGPLKLDLANWRSLGVWADPRTCAVSMEHLPWGGGTFPEQQISEAGRQFLLGLLQQLSPDQIRDAFAGARVELSESVMAEARDPSVWATAFLDKVRQVREAGPCPNRN